jgi:hypothetical protein
MNAGPCWGKNTKGPREAGVLKKPREATLTFLVRGEEMKMDKRENKHRGRCTVTCGAAIIL